MRAMDDQIFGIASWPFVCGGCCGRRFIDKVAVVVDLGQTMPTLG
jgi:hypothetical protein